MIFFALADYKSRGNDKCKNLRNRHCPPNSVYAENDWQYQNANAFEKQCAQKRNEGGNRAVIERSEKCRSENIKPGKQKRAGKDFESANGKLIKLRVVADEYFCHSARKKKASAVELVPIIKRTKSKR